MSLESFLAPVRLPQFRDPNDSSRYLSLLEMAIHEVNVENSSMVWPHTPGFLSQADIMTGLAPVATTRGDTFLIRAYGADKEPISGRKRAEAMCEALVQRLPDPLATEGASFGRRFVLLDFRWIDKEEP